MPSTNALLANGQILPPRMASPYCVYPDGCKQPRTHKVIRQSFEIDWHVTPDSPPEYAGYAGAVYCKAHAEQVAARRNGQGAEEARHA